MPDSKAQTAPAAANSIFNNSSFVTVAARVPDVFVLKMVDWRYSREAPFVIDEGGYLSMSDFASIVSNWVDNHPNGDVPIRWNEFINELINSTIASSGPSLRSKPVNYSEVEDVYENEAHEPEHETPPEPEMSDEIAEKVEVETNSIAASAGEAAQHFGALNLRTSPESK